MFQIKNRKFSLNNNGEDPVSHAACLVSSMVGSMVEKCCLHWSPTEVFQVPRIPSSHSITFPPTG